MSRKNIPNKSTAEIKNIFAKCEANGKINWEKLLVALYKRALKPGGDKAGQTILEYRFGKAPQPLEHSGMMGVKVIKDNIGDRVSG